MAAKPDHGLKQQPPHPMNHRIAPAILILLLAAATVFAADPPFPGKKSQWEGFDRYDFEVGGHPAIVVVPKQAMPGRPWAWRGTAHRGPRCGGR